jgi:hypothetical protein
LQDVFIPPRQQHRRTPEPIDVVIDSGVHLHRENEMQPMQREQSPEGVNPNPISSCIFHFAYVIEVQREDYATGEAGKSKSGKFSKAINRVALGTKMVMATNASQVGLELSCSITTE